MKISRNNYEAYFIDYLDGKLSDSQIHELESLLLNNEDLREELEGLEKILLKPDMHSFGLKENLKRPDLESNIDEENFEFYCIADMEGDLSIEKAKELSDYLIQNPDKKQIQRLIQDTRLQIQDNIIFKNKEGLKRSIFTIRKVAVYRSLSIAAGIAILLALFFTIIEKDVENAFIAEAEIIAETPDTTAIRKIQPEQINSDKETKQEPAEKPKPKTSGISFKVSAPIASVEKPAEHKDNTKIEEQKPEIIIESAIIDTKAVSEAIIPAADLQDKIEAENLKINTPKAKASEAEFLTLQELAKEKLTDLVIQDGEKKRGFWGVASAGVARISEKTGSDMSLSTVQNEDGENKKLSFNSKLLSFSTPINRD